MSDNEDALNDAFIRAYFDVSNHPLDSINMNIDESDENFHNFTNYLHQMGLNNLITDYSRDMLSTISPQFKFVCERDYNLDILSAYNYNDVYIRKGVSVYATNLFVPHERSDTVMKSLVTNLVGENQFAITEEGQVELKKKYYIYNGTDGIVLTHPYVDWSGLKICGRDKKTPSSMLRLYLIGEQAVQNALKKKLPNFTGTVLKNFHKGTPLSYRPDNHKNVISSKTFITNNYDVVFENFEQEFKENQAAITFVQRDYIFDAQNFPVSLLTRLQEHYVSETSVIKEVVRFKQKSGASNIGNRMIIDRFGRAIYKKMVVRNVYYTPPDPGRHLFIPRDFEQLRGTLNAAYVPRLGIVILADQEFFGTTKVLEFEPSKHLYTYVKNKVKIHENDRFFHVGGQFYLEESKFKINDVAIYILVRIEQELLLRNNLIRTSHNLRELKQNWVYNTVLNLFVRKH
ncbi:hypothetical protein [Epinotia aporema granulovirus]|uniref:P49 n=1 Tax=Epinotia aporema granulovirus TaxID=166056 RepID=K4ER55_9BBAC|nr:hypothetical protein [Epinotia aporema granulovirus]AER41454.1 hypothetical protein [Epinotia aporema granulovirus]